MRSAEIKQLKLWSEGDLAEYLTTHSEDQWFDRISARSDARHLADAMIAFANAEGGLIAIGVHSGVLEDIAGDTKRINAWRQAALDFTKPPVRHKFELVDCSDAEQGVSQVALIEVESSERVHTNVRSETYLRVGDENRKLDPLQAQELRFDKGESAFDGTVIGGSLATLDEASVDRYMRKVRARVGIEVALQARGLAVAGKGGSRPTVAGLLILGSTPQSELPQSFIRVLQYKGVSREWGVSANITADRRLEGTLVNQIAGARRLLKRMLPQAIRLGHAGRFAGSTLIPETVWLEAIVNAVTHRSYSMGGDHIRIELFDDRLEVNSPGRLPGLVRLDSIRSTRFARNPRVARGLSDLGYGRELGEGINRMFEEMARAGLPDPVYTQGAATVSVVLLANPISRQFLDTLPRGSERFIEYLMRRKRITTSETLNLLGVSRPTALRLLRELADRGMIQRVGTSKNDPQGFWRLVGSPRTNTSSGP